MRKIKVTSLEIYLFLKHGLYGKPYMGETQMRREVSSEKTPHSHNDHVNQFLEYAL